MGLFLFETAFAKPDSGVKYVTIRTENPDTGIETLILPYFFSTDSLGFTLGLGGGVKGYWQDQLIIGGTVYGSFESAYGAVLGLWDLKVPGLDHVYFSAYGSTGYFPKQRAYAEYPGINPGIRAGSNDSDPDDFIEDSGMDNQFEIKLEYVLPFNRSNGNGSIRYSLKNGLLASGASGGRVWNPLKSGVTILMLKQYNRYQSYKDESGILDGTIHPLKAGLLYNNTDFAGNPTRGSSQYLAVTRDFGWLESNDTWTFVEFEASKYFSMGESDWAQQRVLALNVWTGDTPTWNESDESDSISNRPPFLAGANLGGFYRMRGYPNHRFNDRSVIYTSAEYRYIPKWNPLAEISWLKFLNLDWWQFAVFVEAGRVAGEYNFSELGSDWKVDAGIGIRLMVAASVVRFDIGFSEEGINGWVMFGHSF